MISSFSLSLSRPLFDLFDPPSKYSLPPNVCFFPAISTLYCCCLFSQEVCTVRIVVLYLLCCSTHRIVCSKYVVDCSVSARMIFVTVVLFDRGTSENLEAEVVHSHRQLSLLLWIHHSEYDCVTLMDTSTSKHFTTSLGLYYTDLLLYFSLN